MDNALAERFTALEDIEAIKELKSIYCYLLDAGVAGDSTKMDELVELFTDDCLVDFSELGVHQGRKAVADFYKDLVPSTLSYSAHMVSNPMIEVDGKTATGKWYFIVPCTFRQTAQASWVQGRYDEEYVKMEGQWKWKSITARFDHITPFEDGWAKTRMVSL